MAQFLVDWAVREKTDRVLDPSCGEAVFLDLACRRLVRLGAAQPAVVGVELDRETARAARIASPESTIIEGDFFEQDIGPCDAIVGNPPYVRYHYFKGITRKRGLARAAEVGVALPELSSSWAPFLVHATTLLNRGGRLAFVLPAELLTSDYAEAIRTYLLKRFAKVTVVTFEERVFPGALIEVVLLLAEGDGPGRLFVTRTLNLSTLIEAPSAVPAEAPNGKWTEQLLTPSTREAFRASFGALSKLGDHATVDIGLVTGNNSFFVINESAVNRLELPAGALRKALSRAGQLPAPMLSREEWEIRRNHDEAVWLFAPASTDDDRVRHYIQQGEATGVHKTYKCRIRTPWWKVKLQEPAELLLTYMSHGAPRIAVNEARVMTTNLLHQVRLVSDVPGGPLALALSWWNSATMLSCELSGRAYGGGVLKLETKEAENVLIPTPGTYDDKRLRWLSQWAHHAVARRHIAALVDEVDSIVLAQLSPTQRAELRSGWEDLKKRRQARARSAK
jgi:adenine-specific DNA methylase